MTKSSAHRQWEKRKHERGLAFQVLYGTSFSDTPTLQDLKQAYLRSPDNPYADQEEPAGFAWDLLQGVWDNEKFLDRDIKKFSRNWRIERMGRIELLILRLALYELKNMGTPAKVVIAEYLSLADQFGMDSSKSFINGILDAAAKEPGYIFKS